MNKKILIVDDEKEIVDLLEVYLSNDGYSVYKCYNGLEAMKCIKQSQIDLAILDIMLPDENGYEIVKTKDYKLNLLQTKYRYSLTDISLLCKIPITTNITSATVR